jgi:hypothetical protein
LRTFRDRILLRYWSDADGDDVSGVTAENAERAAILEGGSGAFAIRKEGKSKYVITINAGGQLVDIPVGLTKVDGIKFYLLGEVCFSSQST